MFQIMHEWQNGCMIGDAEVRVRNSVKCGQEN